MKPIIELLGVDHIYNRGTSIAKEALCGINMCINPGEIVGIVGETGSGKTTLIQHFNGILKPTNGQVLYRGTDIWKTPALLKKICFQVGLVFQYPEQQLFEKTLELDIAFGPKNMGLSSKEIEYRVKQALDFVGLDENLLDVSPFTLSMGMKRRAAIAGVLAMTPEILVMDEPTAGLDPQGGRQILNNLSRYCKERESALIMVSHNLEELIDIVDRVVIVHNGQIAENDSIKNILLSGKDIQEYGMELPMVTRLFRSLADKGIKVPGDVFTLEQAVDEIKKLFEE